MKIRVRMTEPQNCICFGGVELPPSSGRPIVVGDEARAALAKLQELQPGHSIAWIERNIPYTPGPMAKFLEGMRKAGLT